MVPDEDDAQMQFLRLYNSAQPVLRGYLMAWLRDFHRAEDLLQETSLVLWKQFGEFRKDGSFPAWALGIARNIVLKELRASKMAPKPASPEILELVAVTYEREAPRLEKRRWALDECLERLSPKLRELVDLHYGHSLQLAEIAGRIGRSIKGVAVSLFRARQWLADCTRRALDSEPS